MNLSQRYLKELQQHNYQSDAAQLCAVDMLSNLTIALETSNSKSRGWQSLFSKRVTPRGVYLWGGVGRGKTFIMDLFYDEVKVVQKKRIHFHRFMKYIHEELNALGRQKDPVEVVIAAFAKSCRLLCLDEFFVSDIGDAMILSHILDACYAEGIVVVTTSNIYPDGLYANGLQRSRFLPAIEGIKRHFEVLQLDGGVDYRLKTLQSSSLYYTPLGPGADSALNDMFIKLVPDLQAVKEGIAVSVAGRAIPCVKLCEDIVWFSFSALCEGPRSVHDYIELAKEFHAVLLSDIPAMGVDNDDAARRFVNMVDEFYDRGVKLIVSAHMSIDRIYTGVRLEFEFERTKSRLLEMQSDQYLAKAHAPD